jgi:hypothetical protein
MIVVSGALSCTTPAAAAQSFDMVVTAIVQVKLHINANISISNKLQARVLKSAQTLMHVDSLIIVALSKSTWCLVQHLGTTFLSPHSPFSTP